jgi:hypothetical protein
MQMQRKKSTKSAFALLSLHVSWNFWCDVQYAIPSYVSNVLIIRLCKRRRMSVLDLIVVLPLCMVMLLYDESLFQPDSIRPKLEKKWMLEKKLLHISTLQGSRNNSLGIFISIYSI